MALDVPRFLRLRPALYHLTDRANLGSIARSRLIEPAADLIRRSGKDEWLGRRRAEAVPLRIDGGTVVLKDQRPLIFANADLAGGWGEEDFVAHLNEHVFFWPGDERGPVKHGDRLFSRYESEGPAIVRTSSTSLIDANPGLAPLFCAFNSGAPRMRLGRPVRRGSDIFLAAQDFPRTAGKVIEVVFRGAVRLPAGTEVSSAEHGWTPLGI